MFNEPLERYTTLKIGGPAEMMVETDNTEELAQIWKLIQDTKTPHKVIGGGSNLLFADRGFSGIVLKIKQTPFRLEERANSTEVNFPSGYMANLASIKLLELGLSGFEAMHGLPGTIGGAIFMNSKWPKDQYQTSDNLLSVSYLNERGELVRVNRTQLSFAYGYSTFQERPWLILGGNFTFTKVNPQTIAERHQAIAAYRRSTQPTGVKTAGCVFKNISESKRQQLNLPTASAGYLIDQCGLKGKQIGRMSVSSIHANFFINEGGATAANYRELLDFVRYTVLDKFKVDLKEEVDFVE